MKTSVKFFLGSLLVALGMPAGNFCQAAVSFTVAPPAVSNTYSGAITLQVTGLTNTETVVVQKFLDLNTNGVIDASDYLVQQFNLTDGANFVIGGVTNFNVPGDLNSATGTITATLNFQNGDFVQNIVGKYLYKLSSPVGHFMPITNSFAVTNFPYAQKITGNVVNHGTNVPNAVVVIFPASGGGDGPGNPVGGTVANNSGAYSIQIPPGSYVPLAFRSNYVANFGTSPVLTLGGGATFNTNLTLTNATTSISGKIVDANNSALGLPGIFLPLSSDDGSIAVAFTDTNGNFTARVRSGQWNFGDYAAALTIHGYVGHENGTNVNADATGVVLSYPKANALFYGSVKDGSGNPLTGVHIFVGDNNNPYAVDTYTDMNGNYIAGVVGGSISWSVSIDNNQNGNLTNYVFSQGNQFSLGVGQAVQQNFGAILGANHITGHVQFNGNPVAGVQVYATANINGLNYQAQMDTDGGGNYSLNVGNGGWNVNVFECCDDDSLDNLLGNGSYQSPSSQGVTINNNNGTANFTVQPCGGIQIFTTSPLPNGQAGSFYNVQFYASSCNGNFNWSLNSGALPPGLMLYSGGVLNGTPNQSGTFNFSVHVSDNSGAFTNQSFSLFINPPLQVTTTSLPNGNQNQFYSTQLSASGGQPPYTWSLNGDSTFGLTLSSNGILSGTPNSSGNHTYTIFLTDSNLTTATTNLTLIINAPASPLQINTTFLPSGTNGTFYSQTLQASGGTPPYSWTKSPFFPDSLPPNLVLATNGVLSGTLATNGTFYYFARVTDAALNTADSQELSLTIVNPPLQITTTSLPNGNVGAAYSAQLNATGGQTPYNWTNAPHTTSLPPGLTINPSGLISGTPTTNGTTSLLMQVTDANFTSLTKALSITINPKPSLGLPSKISSAQFEFLLTGVAGQNYTLQYSSNLLNWAALFITNNPVTGSFMVIDPHATNQRGFYRVLQGP